MSQTYCRNGHEYRPENTYTRPDGKIECRICRRQRNVRYRAQNLAACRRRGVVFYHKLRTEVLELLGARCGRCENNDPRVLQLDHLFGGGSRERRAIRTNCSYKRALEYPEEYQILCANCNWIKRAELNENAYQNESFRIDTGR